MGDLGVMLASLPIGVFFPVLFLVYWPFRKHPSAQNLILLCANAGFYALWSGWFVAVLFGQTLLTHECAQRMAAARHPAGRRRWMVLSAALDLGLFGYFKYMGFLVGSLCDLFRAIGLRPDVPIVAILAPLGISFLTLQRLSYTFDIYRRRVAPVRNRLGFLTALTFFPLVVAGPIERPRRLVPQFNRARAFDRAAAAGGLRQILWGLVKKRLIADRLAPVVAGVFAGYTDYAGSELAAGAVLFAVQLYADFSGYSDIAIGCAALLGIRIRANFRYPYFARDIGEFWRRWHISLSTWFRDYLFTPLVWRTPVSRRLRRLACILLTFTATGLWHGANWTFVFWGLLNGLFFVPLVARDGSPWAAEAEGQPRARDAVRAADLPRVVVTFALVCCAWIVFRADSLGHAGRYVASMCRGSWLTAPRFPGALAAALLLLGVEWLQRERTHALDVTNLPVAGRWCLYVAACLALLLFSKGQSEFIYMRF